MTKLSHDTVSFVIYGGEYFIRNKIDGHLSMKNANTDRFWLACK